MIVVVQRDGTKNGVPTLRELSGLVMSKGFPNPKLFDSGQVISFPVTFLDDSEIMRPDGKSALVKRQMKLRLAKIEVETQDRTNDGKPIMAHAWVYKGAVLMTDLVL